MIVRRRPALRAARLPDRLLHRRSRARDRAPTATVPSSCTSRTGAPHTPLQALRADYDALSQIEDPRLRVYAAMVRAVDRSVGRVLEALREERARRQHAGLLHQRQRRAPTTSGCRGLNQPYRGWKLTLFEGGIHVPFFAKWPARIPAGTKVDAARVAPRHLRDRGGRGRRAAAGRSPDRRRRPAAARWRGASVPRRVRSSGARARYQAVRAGRLEAPGAGGIRRATGSSICATIRPSSTSSRRRSPRRSPSLRALLAAHNAEQAPPLWPSFAEMPVAVDKTLLEPDAPDDAYIYWPN